MSEKISNLTISEADPVDAEEILKIELESFSSPWSLASISDAIKSSNTATYKVEDNDKKICAFAVLMFNYDEGELLNIAVSGAYRRMGLGAHLLSFVMKEAERKGVAAVYLEVRESNTGARNLYRSAGFTEIGVRKKYYQNPTEDAVLMMKKISE